MAGFVRPLASALLLLILFGYGYSVSAFFESNAISIENLYNSSSEQDTTDHIDSINEFSMESSEDMASPLPFDGNEIVPSSVSCQSTIVQYWSSDDGGAANIAYNGLGSKNYSVQKQQYSGCSFYIGYQTIVIGGQNANPVFNCLVNLKYFRAITSSDGDKAVVQEAWVHLTTGDWVKVYGAASWSSLGTQRSAQQVVDSASCCTAWKCNANNQGNDYKGYLNSNCSWSSVYNCNNSDGCSNGYNRDYSCTGSGNCTLNSSSCTETCCDSYRGNSNAYCSGGTCYAPPSCSGNDTSCGSYPNCTNCNNSDGCYAYGDGCEERNYGCSGSSCNYSYSNRHTDGYEGGNHCYDNDVYRDSKDYYCSGSCSSSTSKIKQDECTYGCDDSTGTCKTGCAGSITANVKDKYSSAAMYGTKVYVDNVYKGITDSSGKLTVQTLDAICGTTHSIKVYNASDQLCGTANAKISKAGQLVNAYFYCLPPSQQQLSMTVSVQPKYYVNSLGDISINVKDIYGAPINSSNVVIYNPITAAKTTKTTDYLGLAGYSLTASKTGTYTFQFNASKSGFGSAKLSKGITINGSGTIEVSANTNYGKPMGGVYVYAAKEGFSYYYYGTTSAVDGKITFSNPGSNSVVKICTNPNFSGYCATKSVLSNYGTQKIAFEIPVSRLMVKVFVPDISCRVDSTNPYDYSGLSCSGGISPVVNANIVIDGTVEALTNSGGMYIAENLPKGTHNIEVYVWVQESLESSNYVWKKTKVFQKYTSDKCEQINIAIETDELSSAAMEALQQDYKGTYVSGLIDVDYVPEDFGLITVTALVIQAYYLVETGVDLYNCVNDYIKCKSYGFEDERWTCTDEAIFFAINFIPGSAYSKILKPLPRFAATTSGGMVKVIEELPGGSKLVEKVGGAFKVISTKIGPIFVRAKGDIGYDLFTFGYDLLKNGEHPFVKATGAEFVQIGMTQLTKDYMDNYLEATTRRVLRDKLFSSAGEIYGQVFLKESAESAGGKLLTRETTQSSRFYSQSKKEWITFSFEKNGINPKWTYETGVDAGRKVTEAEAIATKESAQDILEINLIEVKMGAPGNEINDLPEQISNQIKMAEEMFSGKTTLTTSTLMVRYGTKKAWEDEIAGRALELKALIDSKKLTIVEMAPVDWDTVVKSIATTTGYTVYYSSNNESSEVG